VHERDASEYVSVSAREGCVHKERERERERRGERVWFLLVRVSHTVSPCLDRKLFNLLRGHLHLLAGGCITCECK
jgi:hypothetical protein